MSATCICARLPLATTCLRRHLSLRRVSSQAPEGRRQRGGFEALSGQDFHWPSGEVTHTSIDSSMAANSRTKHTEENTKMLLSLLISKYINSPLQENLLVSAHLDPCPCCLLVVFFPRLLKHSALMTKHYVHYVVFHYLFYCTVGCCL